MYKNYQEYKKNRKTIDFLDLPEKDDNLKKDAKIAIIVPFRNRIEHLKMFMEHFNKFDLKPDIYIIDQNNADKFNRGLLLNLGYIIAKRKHYDRYIFHDVDSYPNEEMFELYYKFIDKNVHYAAPDIGYKYIFYNFLGGVIGVNGKDFEQINGFPNTFFGWGGEDDAFYNRIAMNNIKVYRPKKGKFILPEHDKPTSNEINEKKQNNILNDLKNYRNDGLQQLLNLFINIKKFDIQDFIKTYENYVSNQSNDSELLSDFLNNIDNDGNYFVYKIDYLATHTIHNDIFYSKKFVNDKINEKKQKDNYIQHKKHPEFMSIIEPLLSIKEIENKIINTYTDIKKFKLDKPKLEKEENIFNLVNDYFSIYKTLSKDDLFKTIKFIFNVYNELLYFRIRNNKIECSYHLYNLENQIDWYKNLKYKKDNEIKDFDKSLIEIMAQRNKYYTIRNPHFKSANNCLLSLESYLYFEGNPTSYVKNFKTMIEYTINKYKNVPDCDILINRKDFQYLRTDNKYAYEHLLKEEIKNAPEKYYFLGSQSSKKINYDIPVPSSDEWDDIEKFEKLENVKWEDKKPIAFFRGSGTGCGTNPNTNPRYRLAQLSFDWNKDNKKKGLIDVGLSKIPNRIRLYDTFIINEPNNKYDYLLGSFVDTKDQLKYKYIFNVEGNAQAYRYPNEFKKQSVILNVKSEFRMWFEPLLKDNQELIYIDSDLHNLEKVLLDLRENDKKAKEIAMNGYEFSKSYINKDTIAMYWFYYMFNINNKTN